MRSSLFRKLVAIACVGIAITLAAIDYTIARHLWARELEAVESRLEAVGTLAAESMSRSEPNAAALDGWCRNAQASLQAIDSNGVVIAACNSVAGSIGITAVEAEVQEALRSRLGRTSRWIDGDLYAYVAVPIRFSRLRTGALRLTAPVQPSQVIRWQVGFIVLTAAVFALIAAARLSRRLARRVTQLHTYAEALLEGQGVETGIPGSDDALGSLERSLHRVAERLRELSERWSLESSRSEAILSSMAEGVLAVDPELRVVFCNAAVMRAMGIRSPLRERTPAIEFVRHSELVGILKQVVSSGDRVKQNVKIARADGRAFQVQAAPFATAAGQGAIAILYDTTDLERLEQVRKDFVANVSHEMRTPLAVIVGYSDTLLDGGLEDPENNRKFVEAIRNNANRLNSIASDLLALSELESGINPGEPDRISIRDALESAIAGIEPEARSRKVQVIRGEIEDADVLGYRFRLDQAMLNLLVNAVKFNKDGGEVRVEARHSPGGHIRISVSDTGAGIPSQDLPRIFERFYRVDKARSRQVGGTGLGLSIVRHVIERMDGKIEVESQLGKGSTFTIILPAC